MKTRVNFWDEFDGLFNVLNNNNLNNDLNYDVIEDNDNYIIELLLAGLSKDNIHIDIENNRLKISATRNKRNVKYNHNNSYFGTIEKYFRVPDNVNINDISSSYNNGILSVKLPKKVEGLKKKISIS